LGAYTSKLLAVNCCNGSGFRWAPTKAIVTEAEHLSELRFTHSSSRVIMAEKERAWETRVARRTRKRSSNSK
jgi:hypothetical protein